LLDELEKFIKIPENIKEAINLTKYAVITRYPGEYDEKTKERYEESVKIANNCLEWLEKTIRENEEKRITNRRAELCGIFNLVSWHYSKCG
jgi:HEPN domain-containing protein